MVVLKMKRKTKKMMMSSHELPYGFILFFLVVLASVNPSSSQFNAPQNIETHYPTETPPPTQTPINPPAPAPAPFLIYTPPFPPPPPPPVSPTPSPSRTSKKAIITAVGVTAGSTFVLAAVFFLLFTRYKARRRNAASNAGGGSNRRPPLPTVVAATGSRSEFKRFDGNVKGLIVDEDGLDVFYWKKLKSNSGGFHREPFDTSKIRGRSSSSHSQIHPDERAGDQSSSIALQAVGNSAGRGGQRQTPPPHQPGQQPALSTMAVPKAPPPPAPPAPPPPPALPAKKAASVPPPPPPPVPGKKAPMPPPPSRSPAAPPKPPSGQSRTLEAVAGAEGSGSGNNQVPLKPLHWEKVNVNRDHSMVWDKIERGSFQYNGDMMEALFGVVAAKRRSPDGKSASNNAVEVSNPNAKIFILDPRKSQNIAIVLKSLGIPRDELTDSLLEGKGLSTETLEKLTRAAPTREEESEILAFDGDPTKLADAESFLYSLLKAVPSAFTRANEMLFRLNYDSEILSFKESLQTLEAACTELRSRGVFLKLLEAILKAGNRLNAGTSRGDAKAFNLTTLRKLSDYKSSDGKTTLLHFVVHEVVRNEGRRCVLARNNSIGRQSASSSMQMDDPASKEEREREFLKLGLPVVGGLSSEFSNVKKAANIDYDALQGTLTSLTNCVREAGQLVGNGRYAGGGGGFLNEMSNFVELAQVEIKAAEEEHTRVTNLVNKTTQYYQARTSNDKNPLQLFVIVKDFLGMVDQTCIEIARSLQQKKQPTSGAGSRSGSGSGSSQPDVLRSRVTFPRLPAHYLSDKSSSSSDDDS